MLKGFFGRLVNKSRASVPGVVDRIGKDGLYVLKDFEQCHLDAYWDGAGKVWTIGWGHTGPDVYEGLGITQNQADLLLEDRLKNEFEPAVRKALKLDTTQGQFDAMVVFAYNVGVGAFKNSTLLRRVNEGRMDGASNEFGKWVYAGGVRRLGLARRREAERQLFLGASGQDAVRIGRAFTW